MNLETRKLQWRSVKNIAILSSDRQKKRFRQNLPITNRKHFRCIILLMHCCNANIILNKTQLSVSIMLQYNCNWLVTKTKCKCSLPLSTLLCYCVCSQRGNLCEAIIYITFKFNIHTYILHKHAFIFPPAMSVCIILRPPH